MNFLSTSTNTIEQFLSRLRAQGVNLWIEGGQLRYRAPKGVLTPDALEQMRNRKEEILAFLNNASLPSAPPSPITPTHRDGIAPLSFAQQRMWFLYRLEGQNAAYNVPETLRLTGVLHVAALEKSINEIIRRHEALRTSFTERDGQPVQVIAPELTSPLPVVDMRHLPEAERYSEAGRLAAEEANRPFDLTKVPLLRATLLRLKEEEHVLLATMHHIISDGWSKGVLTRELAALYASFSRGDPSPLPELPIQYADYAHWQRQNMAGKTLETHLDYWKRQLAGAPPVLELPTDHPRPAVRSSRGGVVRFEASATVSSQLRDLCRQSEATLFMALLAAFAALLSRYCGSEDVVVGANNANRNRPEIEPLIGFFVNTLALRVDLSGNPSFPELLGRVRQVALDAYTHQDTPFEQLVEFLRPERSLSHIPLVQVMFVLQNAPMGKLELPGLAITPVEIARTTAKFDLTLIMEETDGGFWGEMEYSTDLFDEATIRRMVEHFKSLLERVTAHPEEKIADVPLLTEIARRQVLVEWNNTYRDYARDKTIHQLFEAQVHRTPDAAAAVFHPTDSGQGVGRQLTYRELDVRANQLAHRLQKLGVGPEVAVGVCMERSAEMIVGLMGVLKAGGAYVPMEPSYPKERLSLVLEDAGVRVLLTQERLLPVLPEIRNQKSEIQRPVIVCLDRDWETISQESREKPADSGTPENLAYVIYTSGSTGRPKGVMIEHRSVVNLVSALVETVYVRYDGTLRVGLMASMVFDASAQQIFACLLQGHTLYIVDDGVRRDGKRLCRFFQENAIDVADCTPGLLSIMVEAGMPGIEGLALKHLIVGGEALPSSLIAEFYRRGRHRKAAITNVYGPTECCVDATAFTVDARCVPAQSTVPIGRPLANTRIYILDKRGTPVPVGVPGEICIAGDGVGRGYINDPRLTEERFTPHPALNEKRLYHTGDVGRWNALGDIEFQGRNDGQVKIRGHRVETGEIENHLRAHPAAQDVLVVARETSGGYKELVAYLVLKEAMTVSRLRDYLRQKLPEYMIPAHFVALEKFPLNSSGKIDRRALPDPDASATLDQGNAYVSPRDERERALAQVWESVLGRHRISVKDNYFGLGGDSIKALQIVARLRRENFRLEIRDLFLYPILEELAPHLAVVERSEEKEDAEAVTGAAPLMAIQRWFFQEYRETERHYNQSLLLKATEVLDAEALRAALQKVQECHGALRMRYHREQGDWVQEIGGADYPFSFEVVDLRAGEGPVSRLSSHAAGLQSGVNLERGPLMKAAIYRLRDGDRLFLMAHHLVVDGVSWRIILEDLCVAYRQAQKGGAISLPPGTDSFKRWAERIQAYSNAEALNEIPYWRAVEEFPVPPLPADFATGSDLYLDCSVCAGKLSREETASLLTRTGKAYNTEINDLLLTALGRAMRRWHGQPKTAVMLEGHGREPLFGDLDISRTVGWFTSMYPVILDLSGPEDMGRQIKTVKETLRGVPRKGVGYGILRHITAAEQKRDMKFQMSPRISFNYLGQLDDVFQAGPFQRSHEETGPAVDPKARRPFELEFVGMVAGGCFEVMIGYNRRRFSGETIRRLMAIYREELAAVMEHTLGKKETELTPSDIDYQGFDVAQLDEFMDNL